MFFQCINIRQVPWEALKTAAFGFGFQHLPRDLAIVNVWNTMLDPYIGDSPVGDESDDSMAGGVSDQQSIFGSTMNNDSGYVYVCAITASNLYFATI